MFRHRPWKQNFLHLRTRIYPTDHTMFSDPDFLAPETTQRPTISPPPPQPGTALSDHPVAKPPTPLRLMIWMKMNGRKIRCTRYMASQNTCRVVGRSDSLEDPDSASVSHQGMGTYILET